MHEKMDLMNKIDSISGINKRENKRIQKLLDELGKELAKKLDRKYYELMLSYRNGFLIIETLDSTGRWSKGHLTDHEKKIIKDQLGYEISVEKLQLTPVRVD
jgi:hypothetical protein